MIHEHQNPQDQNLNPGLQEISSQREIAILEDIPAIGCEELFSSNKMRNAEYPDNPGVRVALDAPISTAFSDRSDVEQDLMAVIALGQHVALGVVTGKDQVGDEVNYLSLLNNDLSDRDNRARTVGVLAEGAPLTIGRIKLEQVAGHEGVIPGVSRTHCSVVLREGILTVIDENSTNGTRIFTNKTGDQVKPFMLVHEWSQPSPETKKLIEAGKEAKRQSRASQLGRFTVDKS